MFYDRVLPLLLKSDFVTIILTRTGTDVHSIKGAK